MLLALYSSFRDRALPSKLVCFGEIGLSGEVRPVHDGQERLREAESHGYEHALIPAANAPRQKALKIIIHPVKTVAEALECIASLAQ
jgi:DNA repair protein RadA/Sms